MKNTIIGVDLAKEVIQVCIYTNKKVHSNKEMTHDEFLAWLFKIKPTKIVFEACGTSNYWKQKATEAGHEAELISAKLVATVRQNQKTDKNDALAIVQASQLPDIQFIKGKNGEQQQLQSMLRLRELAIKQKTASSNQIKALLLEFNIRVSPRNGGLKGVVQSTLEDAENGLSVEFRQALDAAWQHYTCLLESICSYDDCLESAISEHTDCKRLLKLEGVGTINAINLYIALGCAELGTFTQGKDASACIGLTPLQHSSGGKTTLGTIGRHVKNSILRSQLITGAMSAVSHAMKRTAITKKDEWIQALVGRRGKKCAAVALANKTVRTAYAMLAKGTEYKAELLPVKKDILSDFKLKCV
ncbi:MAG: IS110 family transposase [Methylococcales bacterium]|nr:IS110 family transposase [Methylococcales bacterium]